MDSNKKLLLLNAFFITKFNYCQLVWMYYNRRKNNKINRLHERCLRLIYNDKKISLRDRNHRVLAIEMYKTYHGF